MEVAAGEVAKLERPGGLELELVDERTVQGHQRTIRRQHLDNAARVAGAIGHQRVVLLDVEELARAMWRAIDECPPAVTFETVLGDHARFQALARHRLHWIAPDLDHRCHGPTRLPTALGAGEDACPPPREPLLPPRRVVANGMKRLGPHLVSR